MRGNHDIGLWQAVRDQLSLRPAAQVGGDQQAVFAVIHQQHTTHAVFVFAPEAFRLATPTGSDIAKGLDGLFRVKGEGVLPDDPEARLVTRSIEGSNVAATTALVDMIEASRSWDTQLKLVSDARDMDSATANLMQLPR